jgi:hypothetical protein
MKVNKEELADLLQFTEYQDMVPEKIKHIAEENGLVIVYGYSDDLIEFDGAIYDEGYASDGTLVQFDRQGIIPEWDTLDKEVEQEVREYFARKDVPKPASINVFQNDKPYYWTYACSIPHATFEVCEGDHRYCKGLVIDLKDI